MVRPAGPEHRCASFMSILPPRFATDCCAAPVKATYGIECIKEALVDAQRRGRHGKVRVLPDEKL